MPEKPVTYSIEPLLVSFAIDFTSGKYGSLAEDINRELKRVGEDYELILIANGKKRGTIRGVERLVYVIGFCCRDNHL